MFGLTAFLSEYNNVLNTIVYRLFVVLGLTQWFKCEGKIINDELEDCGVVFYDTESGIRSFERIVNDLPAFLEVSRKPIRRYQEAIAYPVSKNEYLQSLENKIKPYESIWYIINPNNLI